MSVSSISSNVDPYQAYQLNSLSNQGQQRQSDFKELSDSLKSGDLNGAQQAFSSLQQLLTSDSANIQTQASNRSTGENSFTDDINALGQALKSGDLTTAQADLAQLQKDMQSVGRGHHHHHHGGSSGTQNATSDQGSSNQGLFATDLNALGQALKSGDLTTAQTSFAQLQKDMQSATNIQTATSSGGISSSLDLNQLLASLSTQNPLSTSGTGFQQLLATLTGLQGSTGSNSIASTIQTLIGSAINVSA